MPMTMHDLKDLLQEAFPTATIDVQDLAGDGDHYAATVEAVEFAGKTRVQQHQMVYDALKGKMGGELHALALQTAIKVEE